MYFVSYVVDGELCFKITEYSKEKTLIIFFHELEIIWKLCCKCFFPTSAIHVFKMVTIRAECIQGQAGNNVPSLSQNHNFHIFPVPDSHI